jgi:hypothetical protein
VYHTGYRRPNLCLEPILWDVRTHCRWSPVRTCSVHWAPRSQPSAPAPYDDKAVYAYSPMSTPEPQEFVSKPSNAVRRRLSSVSSHAKPNVSAFSSLTVCPPYSFIALSHTTECLIAYVGWNRWLSPC